MPLTERILLGSKPDAYRLRGGWNGIDRDTPFGLVDVGGFYGTEQCPIGTVVTRHGHNPASHTLDNALFYQVVYPTAIPEIFVPIGISPDDNLPEPEVGFGGQYEVAFL